MSSFNIYGGTPKKTLDLMKYFQKDSSLYVYGDSYKEFKPLFQNTGASVYEGGYGRNIFRHVNSLLKIIDKDKIEIVQTQFAMGEVLGYFIKLFRPQIKLVLAFVGPFEPSGIKKSIASQIYKKADCFVFISNYVKNEKLKQFPMLKTKTTEVIYNGTENRKKTHDEYPRLKHVSLYSTSGLVEWKNINVLVDTMRILKEKGHMNIYLYVAGDGPERENLEEKIKRYSLDEHVFLLGYQKNIGALLEQADIYVHPAYAEGFGIAVAEAMMAEKPTIVANAGALPELVENGKSGFVIDPFDANAWSEAILKLIKDKKMANKFGKNARKRAQTEFSIDKYILNYHNLYTSLMEKK